MKQKEIYRIISEILNSIDIGICIFDGDDRAVIWNPTFLRFFPEHDGHVYVGEPYRANLARFYSGRLVGDERQNVERYIDEGLERHRHQSRPFVFNHLGRRLRVASLGLPDGERIRIWQELPEDPARTVELSLWDEFPIDLLEYLADGAMILDPDDKILATNTEFRLLYDIEPGQSAVGSTLVEVVRNAWLKAGASEPAAAIAVLDSMRFSGAPFEVELPGGRWRRVIARRTARGIGYFTHSDITLLKRAFVDISAMAATDALTGLANRRRFDEVFEEEWRRRMRDGTSISLMLIDIDHFKSINDRFGHVVGDDCLRRIASIVRAAIPRSGDLAARHGGEEFAVLLPDTGIEGAVEVARHFQEAMAGEAWSEVHQQLEKVTASIGIYSGTAISGVSMTDFMLLADKALYRAKTAGRDRIEVHELSENAISFGETEQA